MRVPFVHRAYLCPFPTRSVINTHCGEGGRGGGGRKMMDLVDGPLHVDLGGPDKIGVRAFRKPLVSLSGSPTEFMIQRTGLP